MNERIKELIKESTEFKRIDLGDSSYREQFVFNKEKFAELIVQECAGIYSKIDNGNLHMGTDDYLEALHKTFRS